MINKQQRGITARHARANNRTARLNPTITNTMPLMDGMTVIYVGSLQKPLIEMIHDDQEMMRVNNTQLMRTLQSIGK